MESSAATLSSPHAEADWSVAPRERSTSIQGNPYEPNRRVRDESFHYLHRRVAGVGPTSRSTSFWQAAHRSAARHYAAAATARVRWPPVRNRRPPGGLS